MNISCTRGTQYVDYDSDGNALTASFDSNDRFAQHTLASLAGPGLSMGKLRCVDGETHYV